MCVVRPHDMPTGQRFRSSWRLDFRTARLHCSDSTSTPVSGISPPPCCGAYPPLGITLPGLSNPAVSQPRRISTRPDGFTFFNLDERAAIPLCLDARSEGPNARKVVLLPFAPTNGAPLISGAFWPFTRLIRRSGPRDPDGVRGSVPETIS